MSIEEQLSTEDLKSPTRIIYHVEREIREAISLDDYIEQMFSGMMLVQNYEPSKAVQGDAMRVMKVAKERATQEWNERTLGERRGVLTVEKTGIDMTDDAHLDVIKEIESRETFVKWA